MSRRALSVAIAAMLVSAQATADRPRWQKATNVNCLVWNALPDEGDAVTWSGACVDGKAQGAGTKIFRYLERGAQKEERYVGEMKRGKNQGHGTLYYANGDRFDGDWVDGYRARGTYVHADGGRYVGRYERDMMASGTFIYPNGGQYTGEFLNNQFEGNGKFTYADGSYYSGAFRRGLPNGYGSFHPSHGQPLSGTWINGCLRAAMRVAAVGVAKEQCGFR